MGVSTANIIPTPQSPREIADILSGLQLGDGFSIKILGVPEEDINTHEYNGKSYTDSFFQISFNIDHEDESKREHRRLSVLNYQNPTTDTAYYGEHCGDGGKYYNGPRSCMSLGDSGLSRVVLEAYTQAVGGWFVASDASDDEPVFYPTTDKLDITTRAEFASHNFKEDLLSVVNKHLGESITQDTLDEDKGIAREINLLIAQFDNEIYAKLEDVQPKIESSKKSKNPSPSF